ncbi:MAG: hypothetical protein NVSMB62_24510 [Acidobacteriaceae bacterium]
MATNAIQQPLIVQHRPVSPSWDRVFFIGMIIAMWATVLFGFSKTYFMAGMVTAPLPNKLIHIHGAAFTLWMILLAVQTGLVAVRKIVWHRTLGLVGFGLAIMMVVLGLLASTDALRRGSAPLGLTARTFYVVPISDMVVFSVLVFFAWRARRKPVAHKRLILIATIGLMDAGVGRWPVAYLQANPKMQDLVILGFLLVVMLYDLVSRKHLEKSTLWASLFVVVVHAVRVPFGFTPLWQRFAGYMLKG